MQASDFKARPETNRLPSRTIDISESEKKHCNHPKPIEHKTKVESAGEKDREPTHRTDRGAESQSKQGVFDDPPTHSGWHLIDMMEKIDEVEEHGDGSPAIKQ